MKWMSVGWWMCCFLILSVQYVRAEMAENVYAFSAENIDGAMVSFHDYKGKVLLIVNTASRCGFTPQYRSLEELYQQYKDQGLVVLGFPANNFMGQEPGSNEEIKNFCTLNYQVSFPMFSKISVKGSDIHPLYGYLTSQEKFSGGISWNFNKFLIGRDGKVKGRFESRTNPLDASVVSAIESQL
jgi:glutathione peroxidase